MIPFQSLNAASSTGPGASVDLGTVADEFTLAVHLTNVTCSDPSGGAAGSLNCALEGSLDGNVWYALGTATTGTIYPALSSTYVFAGGFSGNLLARFIRANWEQTTFGGYALSATVDAWVAAKVNEEAP